MPAGPGESPRGAADADLSARFRRTKMINTNEIMETLHMIDQEKLDVRTITMGVSLFECVCDDGERLAQRVYDRVTTQAERLVQVGEEIERDFGVPIVNKRVSVTPAALVTGAVRDPKPVARALDRAGKAVGVDFIGGYTALVDKGTSYHYVTLKRVAFFMFNIV